MSFDARVFLKQGPPQKKNIVRTTSDIPEKKEEDILSTTHIGNMD